MKREPTQRPCFDLTAHAPHMWGHLLRCPGRATTGPSDGFWDRLGKEADTLAPIHLPFGVNKRGQGPENDIDAHHYVCWCGDKTCPLTLALMQARQSGIREMRRTIISEMTDPTVGEDVG